MAHLVGLDIFGQFARDVARTIVAEQPGPMQHPCAVASGIRQGEVQRRSDSGFLLRQSAFARKAP